MAKKTKTAKKTEGRKYSIKECVALAREFLEGDKIAKEGAAKKARAQDILTAEWERRGTETLTAEGLKITRVQTSTMVYDPEGLWAELTPRQRPFAFRRSFNISALPVERRAALMEAVRECMTPAEIKLCTDNALDVQLLSESVQSGKIDAKLVARHATEKKNKPYIRVSTAGMDA